MWPLGSYLTSAHMRKLPHVLQPWPTTYKKEETEALELSPGCYEIFARGGTDRRMPVCCSVKKIKRPIRLVITIPVKRYEHH